MKKFRVLLTRDYIVDISAQNESDAKDFSEFFVSGGLDASSESDRKIHSFEIERIKAVTNDAFEVEEIYNDE